VAADRVRTVAFDVMDTVLVDPFREALTAATGLTPAQLFARRDPELYPAFERGEIDEATYWARHAERGLDVDPSRFHAVRRARTDWIDGMRELLDDLDGLVERVTASNYPVWIEELTGTHLAERFETVLASHHLGVRKPDPAFFERLLDRLGRCVDEVLFVDDRERNVEAARQVGLRAHRFTDATALRRWLAAQGLTIAVPGAGSSRR
jgi:HAD superfamily hydrolase (TIGR01509 family)